MFKNIMAGPPKCPTMTLTPAINISIMTFCYAAFPTWMSFCSIVKVKSLATPMMSNNIELSMTAYNPINN